MRYSKLQDYPWPVHKTTIGFHWSAGNAPAAALVAAQIPRWHEQGVCMVKLNCSGDSGVGAAAELVRAGIMPVVRLWMDKPHPWYVPEVELMQKYVAVGAQYIEGGNEPNLTNMQDNGREWRDPFDFDKLMAQWERFKANAHAAGAIPGLYALSPGGDVFHSDLYRRMFAWLSTHGDRLDDCFIAAHPRPINHPLAYPYDPINQREHPGATLEQDSTCFLMVNWLDELVRGLTGGRQIPIIATEHGYACGTDQDTRYPKITPDLHSYLNVNGFCDMARTGLIPNPPGQSIQLTDAYMGGCFWLDNEYDHQAFPNDPWMSNTIWGRGRDLPAVQALKDYVKQYGVFDRKFWGAPPIEITPPPPAKLKTWQVQETAAGGIIRVAGEASGLQVQLDGNVFDRPARKDESGFHGYEFAALGAGTWRVRADGYATVSVQVTPNQGALLTPQPDQIVITPPPTDPPYKLELGFAQYAKDNPLLNIKANGELRYTADGDGVQRVTVAGKRGFLVWDKGSGKIGHIVPITQG